jgi:hypothetical protein
MSHFAKVLALRLSSPRETDIMSSSLQTPARPARKFALNALSKAQQPVNRAAIQLSLDPGRTGFLRALDSTATRRLGGVDERSAGERVSRRDVAYLIAVEPVAHGCQEKGWV